MPGGAVNTPIPLVSFTRARDRPRFQTARFSEFWQSAIPSNEDKKQMPKLQARANKMFIGVQILKHEPGTDLNCTSCYKLYSFLKNKVLANDVKTCCGGLVIFRDFETFYIHTVPVEFLSGTQEAAEPEDI